MRAEPDAIVHQATALAKAKNELGWTLRYPSPRRRFAAAYRRRVAATATSMPAPARRQQEGGASCAH